MTAKSCVGAAIGQEGGRGVKNQLMEQVIGVRVGVGAVGVGVRVGLLVRVGVKREVGVLVTVGVSVGVQVGVSLGMSEGVRVIVGVSEGKGVSVMGTGDGVSESVGVGWRAPLVPGAIVTSLITLGGCGVGAAKELQALKRQYARAAKRNRIEL